MVQIPKMVSAIQPGQGKVHIPNATQHDKLVKQSQRLVSQTFFGALLKQMRNSPFKNDMLDGGQGGKAFAGLLDQHLADRMACGAGHKLVDAMVRKIEHTSKYQKNGETRKKQTPSSAMLRGLYRKTSMSSRNRSSNVTTDYRA